MTRAKPTRPLPPLRVRREPPTIEEAVVAAQGLTDEIEQQVEIAASLIGAPNDEVRPLLAKLCSSRSAGDRPVMTKPGCVPRKIIVERKPSRLPDQRLQRRNVSS